MLSSPSGITEATKLLAATITKLNAAVAKVYGGSAVFAVVAVEEHHSRSKRQVTPPPPVSCLSLRNSIESFDKNPVLDQQQSPQPRCVDWRWLPSHLQHHVLVHHHLCVLTPRHLARLEQCRRQRLNHLPHDRCPRQKGQLSPLQNLQFHRRDLYSQEAMSVREKTSKLPTSILGLVIVCILLSSMFPKVP